MISTVALPIATGATEVTAGKAAPVVKWAGGKRSLVPHLLRLAPRRFDAFYEPFLGGGSFFLALAPPQAVLNDDNHDLMEVYRAVREDPEGVINALDEMQPRVLDAEYYYHIRATPASELPIQQRAARFIFLNKTCYNGLYRVNRAG
ncbi:MAG: Dam family site-specific DNA-(adenine-N6)-methyltransferase, partial [Armatimonadota bacterium]|nr:Dam family site-specific DNA-(adenine-N6)-methyltransferase [Armatimonadota bacterium]